MQIDLLSPRAVPPLPSSIDLRCCDVRELLKSGAAALGRVSLVVADPPWLYHQAPGHSADPSLHYGGLSDRAIVEILDMAYGAIGERGRLALWATWPKLGEYEDAKRGRPFRWRYVSGGAWVKTGGNAGTGYHWLGAAEPILLYTKGTRLCTEWGALKNAHVSERRAHSEKPWEFMAGWIERWTQPGDIVLDLFAGLGPVAVACLATGRGYLGAELDPKRCEAARLKIWRAAQDV